MWRGRFPSEIRAGTLVIDVRMAVATFLPKLPLPTDFCRETGERVLLIISQCRGFIRRFSYFVGSLCMCDAGLDLLCICVTSCVCDGKEWDELNALSGCVEALL